MTSRRGGVHNILKNYFEMLSVVRALHVAVHLSVMQIQDKDAIAQLRSGNSIGKDEISLEENMQEEEREETQPEDAE